MLYHLFEYLENEFDMPGAGLFRFISFRASMAIITSLIISMVFGGRIINKLRKMQIGETVRDLGLEGQLAKQGTPTMGGLMILACIFFPTLLFAKLDNIYVIMLLVSTVWLGAIGFIDDYIKVFKKNKKGLAGKFKVVGQIGVGIIVGSILYFHPDVTIKEKVVVTEEFGDVRLHYMGDNWMNATMSTSAELLASQNPETSHNNALRPGEIRTEIIWEEHKSLETTIPFLKDNTFDYYWLLGEGNEDYAWLLFIPIVIFIVIAVSNGANMTDGLDGLAGGTSAIIGIALAIFAYISGNSELAAYLNVMYIPNSGEMVVYIAAFVGACIGFLWHNAYPARVFMGDTGSLALGGIIAVFAIAIRKELLIPVLCGIFFIENLSVMLQVGYFKYTKRKFGEGRRIFKMAPLHHHYQKLGMHEAKIVARFWIVGIILAVISIVTLKLR
jgi:phospho-N-acetylmuramoyl-pentapeptide-transferase